MNTDPFQDALVNSALPTILVSCKCDNPDHARQLNVESVETACMSCVETVKTAANVPESARLCLSTMLRAVMTNRSNSNSKFNINFMAISMWCDTINYTLTFDSFRTVAQS